MKFLFVIIIFLGLTFQKVIGQNISIRATTSTPDASAILDIQSTTHGLLIPGMTIEQRDLIVSPSTGLIIFQTDDVSGIYFFNGTNWAPIQTPTSVEPWTIIDTNILNTNIGSVIIHKSLVVNDTTIEADTNAVLNVQSTRKGFLPPRLTSSDRNALISPATGLLIWCSDCGVFGQIQIFNGFTWADILGGPPADIAVGDSYGGGIVAYILQPFEPGFKPGKIHGLIAAPEDQSTGDQWGCTGIDLAGAQGIAYGTGYQNTIDIVSGCSTTGIAARICNELVLNGISDWYLPSKEELHKLYLNRAIIGGFASAFYWSSSEADANTAWVHSFAIGTQVTTAKNQVLHVRAIRAF
ncbi:MAG: DUF1566 domain-containing protein [Saprospiraceae bacterium]